ncbi:hypothetical protein G8770_20730 [Aestuariicella hydrocarbonica]|uniref:Uncharacterized protein n=1 Tax=Pseudomaricurvus hydrocarbonicus TaxID=1470433 RepID=A0A9E5T1Z7_9GAMM|nr:hypothetical protein [Aestuariicella hydrocarbonica]NHO67980.1 hypothetical protein [Aestuariicella hydrocarbonica]
MAGHCLQQACLAVVAGLALAPPVLVFSITGLAAVPLHRAAIWCLKSAADGSGCRITRW